MQPVYPVTPDPVRAFRKLLAGKCRRRRNELSRVGVAVSGREGIDDICQLFARA